MLKRAFRAASIAFAAIVLSACGTAAKTAPEFPSTPVRPTRLPVIVPTAEGQSPATPTAAALQATPTPTVVRQRPTLTPTMTLIAASPTLAPPTEAPTAQPTRAANAEAGKALFINHINGDELIPTCLSCHIIESVSEEEALVKVGPAMIAWKGEPAIAIRARTRVASQTPTQYLRLSILAPNDHLVPNVEGRAPYGLGEQSLMYQDYAAVLTEEQVNDLVAYLLTIRE
ncbi:MAG TPA: hypothetical protein PLD47_09780 [Aggregatilineales bacterium]|nr:hypothetical protein [Anaerolineales bacterium]HRE48002.1 hypothetical protein [Aggregatilineales bacterium]